MEGRERAFLRDGGSELLVDAVCAVRPIREIRVWSPRAASREAFCADVKNVNKINAMPVDSQEAAVRGADVLITATTSTSPVVGSPLTPWA
jgi:alanine dehydrogenase